ncbi:MAG: hypothetical protein KGM98_06570, partial [Bacteroidota bacterium]|nr:hypothetical protein [Bacteroidota bacterium]
MSNQATPDELREFWGYLRNKRDHPEMGEIISSLWETSKLGTEVPRSGWEGVLQRLLTEAKEYEGQGGFTSEKTGEVAGTIGRRYSTAGEPGGENRIQGAEVPGNGEDSGEGGAPVVFMSRRRWGSWAVAASIILLVGLGTFYMIRKAGPTTPPQSLAQSHDVKPPKGTRAVITLANGSQVFLDSAGNGQIAMQNNIRVFKNASGQIQ